MARKGPLGVLDWAYRRLLAETKKMLRDIGKEGCRAVNNAIAQLRRAGANVPTMSGWSCDQKIAFVAALGPAGVTLIITGALTGRLATDTANEVRRLSGRAEDAVRAVSNSLGIKIPDFLIPSLDPTKPLTDVANEAQRFGRRIGLSGLGAETSQPPPNS